MFCTMCHIAFDWRTGKVDKGQIHNPHYYEYMNNNNVVNNNIHCINDNLLDLHTIKKHLEWLLRYKLQPPFEYNGMDYYNGGYHYKISDIHRSYVHIENVEIFRIDPFVDNEELRMDYLTNVLSEEDFKIALQRKEKANEKRNEINLVFMTYMDIIKDLINSIMTFKTFKELEEFDNSVERLRIYINDSFKRISRRYQCVTTYIDESFACTRRR